MRETGRTYRRRVVRSEADREAVLQDLRALIESKTPRTVRAEMGSPIAGTKGNVKYFLHMAAKD